MKIKAYAVRNDELEAFREYGEKYGHEISLEPRSLSLKTVDLAKGYDGVVIIGNCNAKKEVIEKLSQYNVKYLATRSAGINNIDLEIARNMGIRVSNVPAYSPNAISEFTVMTALNLLRNLQQAIFRTNVQNFTLTGLIGKELRKQTVGIVGTGRIGRETAKTFNGFGTKVIAYDKYPNEEAKKYLSYCSLEELFEKSDIISLHCPLTDENHHMIDENAIKKMKDGVLIINTARGGLIDTEALLSALYSEKVGGAALDVYEKEIGLLHKDYTKRVITDNVFNQLRSFNNVVITPHYAFYTDEAVNNMVEFSLDSLKQFENTGNSSYELK